jgi:RNA polymerase sigma-70 factor (ECF subfamily)
MKNNEEQLASLLARIKLKDQKAFQQFYELISPQLFALLLKMLQQHSLAEDALQEVFIKIWNKAEQYNTEKGSIIVWAYSITRYHALDKIRQNKNLQQLDVNLQLHEENMYQKDFLTDYADASELEYCIKQLKPEARKSIFLAYYHGYTHKELSEYLKKPIGTVKSWISRSLIFLKQCLENVQ